MKFISYVVCLICFFSQCLAREKVVVLIPFDQNDTTDAILANHPQGNFWYELKVACATRGYKLTTKRKHNSLDVLAVVAFNVPSSGMPKKYPHAKTILFTWEPPCVLPSNFSSDIHRKFDRIMTWDDALVDGQKFRKFNYALGFSYPPSIIPFHKKKLCCMFVGNKSSSDPNELYSKRREMIDYFEAKEPKSFDFYGPDWPKRRPCYRGYAKDKNAIMKRYRFPIVYENSRNIAGYITEKIFDAFSAGCVPVYWGASNVTHWIPKNTFIAREDFPTNAKLHAYLKSMPEEVYNSYLLNIRTFLNSREASLFSGPCFIETFLEVLSSCE